MRCLCTSFFLFSSIFAVSSALFLSSKARNFSLSSRCFLSFSFRSFSSFRLNSSCLFFSLNSCSILSSSSSFFRLSLSFLISFSSSFCLWIPCSCGVSFIIPNNFISCARTMFSNSSCFFINSSTASNESPTSPDSWSRSRALSHASNWSASRLKTCTSLLRSNSVPFSCHVFCNANHSLWSRCFFSLTSADAEWPSAMRVSAASKNSLTLFCRVSISALCSWWRARKFSALVTSSGCSSSLRTDDMWLIHDLGR